MLGKYYYILLSNNTGERLVLDDAPGGWDASRVNLVRHLLYLGVLQTISVEFNFVGQGFKFMQKHRLRYGWDFDVFLQVYKRKGNQFQFEGKINAVPSGSEQRKTNRFKCDVVQSTAVQKFNNREDTEVNVLNGTSLDQTPVVPAAVWEGLVRGKMIQFYTKFNGVYSVEGTATPEHYHHTVPMLITENGNPDVQQVYTVVLDDAPISPGGLRNLDSCFYVNHLLEDQTLNMKLHINRTLQYMGTDPVGDLIGVILRFQMLDDTGAFSGAPLIADTKMVSTGIFGNYNTDYEATLTVPPGYGLLLFSTHVYREGGFNLSMDFDQMETTQRINITYSAIDIELWQDSVVEDSTIPIILPLELFENIIGQINGMPVRSPIFGRTDRGYDVDGAFAYLAITTGEWLRKIPITETQFKTSLKDAFSSYSSVICLGVQITDREVIIDELDNLFNGEINADLGEVDEWECLPLTEFMFNEILNGFPKNEYEQQNGRDEPNTPANYTNSLQCYKKKLDIRSVYCGDSYGIEFARRAGIINTGSSDSRYDDKIFFVDMIKDEGQYISRRLEDIYGVSGVFSPETIMNARIANGQNLLRWRKYLNIPLDKKPVRQIYMQGKDKNSNFTVATALGVSTDGEPIDLGYTSFFLPDAHVFKSPIKLVDLPGIIANPLGLTKYRYKKEDFFDYLLNVDAETDKSTCSWRMIGTQSTPPDITDDTSFENIIKYGDGLNDFIKYNNDDNDNIKYAD